jgi:hypothetical protein
MKFNKLFPLAAILAFFVNSLSAQRIYYTEPDRDDSRRTNFEIIGKINQNILVFKNNRNSSNITVYDNEMKELNKIDLNFMDERWINVDFIHYNDYAYMVYQYQKKDIVYCAAVKIDGDGKRIMDPVILDTTKISWAASNKIYTTVYSDDKQKIMILKINSRDPKKFLFTTNLFDVNLNRLSRNELVLPMEERNDYFTDFLVDNDGGIVFGVYIRKNGGDYITGLKMVSLQPGSDTFRIRTLAGSDRILDEIKIKVDNTNKRYFFTAFYYKQRRGNIEGLQTMIYDYKNDSLIGVNQVSFSEELRRQAKGQDANFKLAFNDYFIKDIILRKDGGFLLVNESMYTTTRGSAFNRWDYMGWNNPYGSAFNNYYYSPFDMRFGSPFNRFGGNQATRYHADNIMILSFDKSGNIEWSNVIPKSQFDDESDGLVSYQMLLTGSELHFLFNQNERRSLLLTDQSIGPDGKITRYPTMKNLNRGVEFMPRYGKQIGARSVLIPCFYRNYLTFAKIDF